MEIEEQLQWARDFRKKIEADEIDYFFPKKDYEIDKQEIVIPTDFGDTRILVYRPNSSKPLPAFINLHGGGFVVGSADGDDPWCRLIAVEAGCAVYNVDYRLAPENKFPIAIEEIYSISKYLFNHAHEFEIDPARIAIGGHSAGGNLATAVCLFNIERGNEIPFIYQIMDYPVLDLLTRPEEKPRFAESISVELGKMFRICYFNNPEEAKNPLASPVYAKNLQNMPPALIITAERDSLAKEAEIYADMLKEAGVPVVHKDYKGLPHGFNFNGEDFDAALDSWHLMARQLKNAFGE